MQNDTKSDIRKGSIMKNYQFICIHDNLVTDDPDITRIEADSVEEAENIALRQSAQPGRSLGNYELYVNTIFVKEDGLEVPEI